MSESRTGKNKLISLKGAVGIPVNSVQSQPLNAKSSADTACTASSTNGGDSASRS